MTREDFSKELKSSTLDNHANGRMHGKRYSRQENMSEKSDKLPNILYLKRLVTVERNKIKTFLPKDEKGLENKHCQNDQIITLEYKTKIAKIVKLGWIKTLKSPLGLESSIRVKWLHGIK